MACEYYKPIGYCSVTIGAEEEIDQNVGVIAGIGVHPSKRGRNVALALINQSLRFLIANNVDTIKADIYEINIPSLRLFSSLGFSEVAETFLF
ncbi:MAG: N-acetyltransferase family protein [Candidatus Hodarchaeales archaeon]|jgi:ribosomal protein S18 acetylase RimI-like enzyme